MRCNDNAVTNTFAAIVDKQMRCEGGMSDPLIR